MERSGRSILLVDDDAFARDTVRELLETIGYSVACACNGLDALKYLQQNPRPDLILCDLMMPVMNGWVFRIEQQNDPNLAGIPVILFSGIHDAASAAEWLFAQGYLEKPIDVGALMRAVERHCGPAPALAELDDEEEEEEDTPPEHHATRNGPSGGYEV